MPNTVPAAATGSPKVSRSKLSSSDKKADVNVSPKLDLRVSPTAGVNLRSKTMTRHETFNGKVTRASKDGKPIACQHKATEDLTTQDLHVLKPAATGLPKASRRKAMTKADHLALSKSFNAPVAYTTEDMTEALQNLETAESRGEKFQWHPAPFTYLWTTPEGRQFSCTITDRTMKPITEAMRSVLKARYVASLPAVDIADCDWQEARRVLAMEAQGLFKLAWNPQPCSYDFIYSDGTRRQITAKSADQQSLLEAIRQLLCQREEDRGRA
jgi:hypothetical protein